MARQVDPRSAETRKNVLNILQEAQAAHYDPKRDATSESKMELTYSYVLAQDAQHWYCSQASETMRECALLLQKLHGYRSEAVKKWKDIQSGMIHRCCDCAQAYEFSKQRLREVYLSAFDDRTLDNFADAVNQWEQEVVLDALKAVNISPKDSCNLNDIPSGVLFHILNNLALCIENPDITSMLRRSASGIVQSLVAGPVPRGLLLFAVDEEENVRTWAQAQLAASKYDTSVADFKSYYFSIVEMLLDCCGNSGKIASSPPAFSGLVRDQTLFGHVARALRGFPPTSVREGTVAQKGIDAFKRAMKWIHDGKEYDCGILQFVEICLHVYSTEIWANNAPNYPDAVFTTITKGDRLEKLICGDVALNKDSDRSLSWIPTLLLGVRDRPRFGNRFQAVFGYLIGLASSRQLPEHVRNLTMRMIRDETTTLLSLGTETDSSSLDGTNPHLTAVRDTVLKYKTEIADVAFRTGSKGVRELARALLGDIFAHDLDAIQALRCTLTDAKGKEGKAPAFGSKLKEPVVHIPLWTEALQKVDSGDTPGLQFMTHIMARSAHIDHLAFSALGVSGEHKMAVRSLGQFLETSLKKMRHGFGELMARFGLVCEAERLDPSMMTDVITLLFSPVTELHNAALELFGDCDGRKACLRFALTHQPQATLRGVKTFVDAFNSTAGKLVEACSVAKSLVRCFVDVIEALCGPERNAEPNLDDLKGEDDDSGAEAIGLLDDPSFDQEAHTMLRPLWTSMCSALALIFSKCPMWAEYFEPQHMVEWMRDALIFGRLMRAHASALQSGSASQGQGQQENGLESMRDVQRELVAWFRLTDAELLYQANELMASFLEGGLIPLPEVRIKLKRRVETSELPKVKKEAIAVILERYPVPESEDVQLKTKQEPSKTGKRRRSIESDDTKSGVPATKAARRDSVLVISDDESAPSGSRSTSGGKLEQSSMNKFLKNGARNKPANASSSANKINISTLKPSANKLPPKPKAPSGLGSGPLAKMRAEAAARQQQTAARKTDVQMRNLVKGATTTAASARPPSRPASSASSTHEMDDSSSAASSSDEEDIKKTTLAALAPTVIVPKKPDPPKRTMVMLDGPPVISAQQKRLQELKRRHDELQRRTARLKPNLEGLHEQILRWSIDHDGPTPLCIGGGAPKLNRVPPKFSSKQDYHGIFHPLLINECWSQILQAKEEGPKDSVLCTIMTRSYIDNFTEVAFNIIEKMPERWFLAETDIVLLRSTEGNRSILAKITGFKRANAANQIASGTMRLSTPVEQMVKVQIQEQWRLSRIYSLSTINREYAALTTAEYYDLFDEVISARSATRTNLSDQRAKDAMRAHRINEPQAKAILSALGSTGFSLIQGPPGTGKTSTICGLAGVFVSSSRTAFLASSDKEQKDKRRLLICAPSNAAIDEVTKRLVDGVRDDKGQPLSLKVVRVGTESSMNVSVTANSLDSLVDEKMAGLPKNSSDPAIDINALRQQLTDIKQKIDSKRTELDQSEPGQRRIALENEFRALKSQRTTITGKLDTARDQQKNASRVLDAARRKFRFEVLSEADVICSTLSGAGHEVLEPFEFETVIIDEAAQAIEIATLIPLRYGCKTCILVGDPQQLPPTVISQLASGLDYNQSLFVRLQRQNPNSVHLLSIQYRMHPTISAVPSRLFYQGRLQDGPDMAQRTQQAWHSSSIFGPYKFFDIAHGQEEAQSNHSQINREEANAALALYERLQRDFRNTKFDYRIGVVSMYRGQVMHIKSRFQAVFGPAILKLIDFNTVDGFQGQEKDIIILSCVRAGMNVQTVGFLADERRMNVAITRSRSSLFVLGHAATLERCNATWKTIVEDARGRGHLVKCSQNYFQSAVQQKVNLPARPTPQKIESEPDGSKKLVSPESTRPTIDIPAKLAPVSVAKSAMVKPARVVPAPSSSRIAESANPVGNANPPATLPARPTVPPSLPQKPEAALPGSSNAPKLPPKPLPPRPQNLPPRKKSAASAFIPKDKQKKTQLGGP
ncbi:DEAD-box type RNA helicase [Ceratobasidium sp. 392]|nr:DEAD-box type RNA helicase [Ceratobasidium sp. 392]